jgi:predicted RNase H-like HicB family nuclease
MNYAIAIEYEKNRSYGVEFPDMPGCFSAGDTMDEALENAKEAAAFHIEGLLDAGLPVPEPRGLEAHAGNRRYAGRTWAIVGVDLSSLSGKARRLNITLPERVLRRLDAAAKKNGESRSGYLARLALHPV